jgi:hypothetical protein
MALPPHAVKYELSVRNTTMQIGVAMRRYRVGPFMAAMRSVSEVGAVTDGIE